MRKPMGYDEAAAFTGEFETIPPGGHVCVIKGVKIDKTPKDNEVMIVLFDIADGASNGYYSRLYERRKKQDSNFNWPGVYRQLTEGNSLPFFKGMITSIEESNQGYKWDWNEHSLIGKYFGGVFGQEEYLGNDGKIKTSTKCMSIRSVQAVRDGVEPPQIKKYSGSNGYQADYGDPNAFQQINDNDLPWA